MQLKNTFTVALPLDEAWDVLLDLERIAPCMPGAELQEIDGDEYRGVVKVKLGAITTQFKGAVTLASVDREAARIVMEAKGRDVRGQGTAAATITAQLRSVDTGTEIYIDTDLSISGKLAQFGRGVMDGVSKRLLAQFVTALEADIMGETPAAPVAASTPAPSEVVKVTTTANGSASGAPSTQSSVRSIASRPAEPVDLLGMAGESLTARVVPAVAIGAIITVAVLRRPRTRLLAGVIGAALVAALHTWLPS